MKPYIVKSFNTNKNGSDESLEAWLNEGAKQGYRLKYIGQTNDNQRDFAIAVMEYDGPATESKAPDAKPSA